MQLRCSCDGPFCGGRVEFRRGYVQVKKRLYGDGKDTLVERWDHLYVDATESGELIQLICPPQKARQLMWFLIWNYLPLVSHVVRTVK